MACLYKNNLSTVLHDVKMDGSYELSGEKTDGTGCVGINTSALKLQCCFNDQSFETGWRVIYVKIMRPDGSSQILKIERNDDNQGHITIMPNDGSDGMFQLHEKQTYYDGSVERECHAVGHITLTPIDGSGGGFGVIVYPIEVKFYIRKYPSPLGRVFGFLRSCFN